MALERTRQRLSALLLLIWLVQSAAAFGAPCPSAQEHGAGTDPAAMHHAGHQPDPLEQPDGGSAGCCDGGGLCSMSHCFSVAALPQTLLSHGFSPALATLASAAVLLPAHPPESPYRPPIPA